MKKLFAISTAGMFLIYLSAAYAQKTGLYMPIDIKKGYDQNTRSYDGKPGKNYWQNRADYDIKINFDPITGQLQGSENIVYYNNSPDSLNQLVFHLFPDYYKKGNRRDFDVSPSDESDGVSISEFLFNDDKINFADDNNNLSFNHTSFVLKLDNALPPMEKVNLEISWHFYVNKGSPSRTGGVDSTTYFVAYFFPRIAVYDDIYGWNLFDYTGDAEFYNDFGNFDLSVTVPGNFLVWATGLLQNAPEVITEKYLERYKSAMISDSIVHIVDSTEHLTKDITVSNYTNTWKFHAENVTDAAFALSDQYLWDASSFTADKGTGRRILINTAFNKSSKDFYEVAKIAKSVMTEMSANLPGIPFPFPVMTVFNGMDYMEYPMMVNDTTLDIGHTPELTTHEIFHSYFPFYTGINETRYAWMDEGLTTFFTYLLINKLYPSLTVNQPFEDEYRYMIGSFSDMPIFINSNKLKRPEYNYIYYDKPLSFFLVLQNFLGHQVFINALKEFMQSWNGKHPTPYDLFFTFERITGKNLDWLIRPWFFEYGYVDLAINKVTRKNEGYEIEIEKKGLLPAHFGLKLFYADSTTDSFEYNAEVWMKYENIYKVFIASRKKIEAVEIEDNTLRDADLNNNRYTIK